MCFTTIFPNMRSSLGRISSISLGRSCTVAISLTIGTEEPMPHILKCSSNQSYYYLTSIFSIISLNLQILPSLTMKVIESTSKRKFLLRFLRCSVCIPMPKSDILLFNARHYLIPSCLLKEVLEKEEDPRTIKPSASSPTSRLDALLSSLCLILQQRSKTLRIKHHTLLFASRSARE